MFPNLPPLSYEPGQKAPNIRGKKGGTGPPLPYKSCRKAPNIRGNHGSLPPLFQNGRKVTNTGTRSTLVGLHDLRRKEMDKVENGDKNIVILPGVKNGRVTNGTVTVTFSYVRSKRRKTFRRGPSKLYFW